MSEAPTLKQERLMQVLLAPQISAISCTRAGKVVSCNSKILRRSARPMPFSLVMFNVLSILYHLSHSKAAVIGIFLLSCVMLRQQQKFR